MTRKDYVAIAAALAEAFRYCDHDEQTLGVERAACYIADVMARDNPRFDRARFLKAVGVQS